MPPCPVMNRNGGGVVVWHSVVIKFLSGAVGQGDIADHRVDHPLRCADRAKRAGHLLVPQHRRALQLEPLQQRATHDLIILDQNDTPPVKHRPDPRRKRQPHAQPGHPVLARVAHATPQPGGQIAHQPQPHAAAGGQRRIAQKPRARRLGQARAAVAHLDHQPVHRRASRTDQRARPAPPRRSRSEAG